MKKYIPIDFDEKGKVILGREKNTPTSNGFIPTTWAPGGSDEGKQGLKSISISPAITTDPALDSLFPIYYDDLTDEQKQSGVTVQVTGAITDESVLTITPTSDWYCICTSVNPPIFGEKGAAITVDEPSAALAIANGLNPEEQGFEGFRVQFSVLD